MKRVTTSRLARRAILVLLVAACGKKEPPPPPPVPVSVGKAEIRAVPFDLRANGTVEPLQTVAVQPQVAGPIVSIAFSEGQEVQKGQVLFQIDPRPFQAALAQAQAALARDRAQAANADQEAKRFQALAQKEYVTAQQYDQARTTAAASQATQAGSQAAVDAARLDLQYATIRAPISGKTGALMVRAGNLVRTGTTTPLVTINQIRPILVRFAVPASELGIIQTHGGKNIPVYAVPTSGGDSARGTLSFIDNAVDTATGTILLKGTFPNVSGSLWPGEFVNVRLGLYVDENVLTVPATAVVAGQQGNYVFVIGADGTAATKNIKVIRSAGDLEVIEGELKSGERVVTDGQLRLQAGSKVQIKAAADTTRQQGIVP